MFFHPSGGKTAHITAAVGGKYLGDFFVVIQNNQPGIRFGSVNFSDLCDEAGAVLGSWHLNIKVTQAAILSFADDVPLRRGCFFIRCGAVRGGGEGVKAEGGQYGGQQVFLVHVGFHRENAGISGVF